jgi:hypothetical protein
LAGGWTTKAWLVIRPAVEIELGMAMRRQSESRTVTGIAPSFFAGTNFLKRIPVHGDPCSDSSVIYDANSKSPRSFKFTRSAARV